MSERDSVMISVVVPVLNEAGNIEALYRRLVLLFEGPLEGFEWELIITDNRSSDDSFEIVRRIAARDARVRGYRFSKNFGYQRSILTGYLMANGDAVVQLDCDMQDPPELIPELVARWGTGASVVYGIRERRSGESALMTWLRRTFYRVVDLLSDDPLPRDVGDFRLVDRAVVEVLRYHDDANPYLRGTIASLGFEQVGFGYSRDARAVGATKFGLSSLFRLAIDGILNHSTRPLQLASLTAFAIVPLAIIGIAAYIGLRAISGQDWPAGFATLALLQLVGIMLNAAFLGIIGAYVGRMYRQVKQAPLVVIEHEAGSDHAVSVLTSHEAVRHWTLSDNNDEGALP